MWNFLFSECSGQFSNKELKKRVCKQSDGSPGICCKDVTDIRQPNLGGQSMKKKNPETEVEAEEDCGDDEYDYCNFGVKSGGSSSCNSK